jgi:hypothetical protein
MLARKLAHGFDFAVLELETSCECRFVEGATALVVGPSVDLERSVGGLEDGPLRVRKHRHLDLLFIGCGRTA